MAFLLSSLIAMSHTIEFMDSRDDNKKTWIIIDGRCKVLIDKVELRNTEKIVDEVIKKCSLQ